MMKHEFEAIAKREVTDEQFEAIEKLYMSSTLNKQDFVKSTRPMLKTIPEPEKEKNIKKMCVRDRSGCRKTPNGCYCDDSCSFYLYSRDDICVCENRVRAVHAD